MGGSANVQSPMQASGKGVSAPQQQSYYQPQQQAYYPQQQYYQPAPQQAYYPQAPSIPQNVLNSYIQQQQASMPQATGKGAQRGPSQMAAPAQRSQSDFEKTNRAFNQGQATPQQMLDAQIKEAGAHGVKYTQEEQDAMLRNMQEQRANSQITAPGEMGKAPDFLSGTPAENLGPQYSVQNNLSSQQDAAMQAAQEAMRAAKRGGAIGHYADGGDVVPPGMSLLMMEKK